MAFVRANDIVLHARMLGKAEGPVLAFSNSLGSDFRIWEDVAALLGERYRILLYDKRGHGLSAAPPGPYTIDDHVDDLIALLDHFNLEKAAIVGVSLGGMIAQRLAVRAPERVKALVLETGRLSRKNLIRSVVDLFHRARVPDDVLRQMAMPQPVGSCICGSGKPFAECHGA